MAHVLSDVGVVHVLWQRTPEGVRIESTLQSTDAFRAFTALLLGQQDAAHLQVRAAADGSILLTNLLLREEKHCTTCGGLILGPPSLEICADCRERQRGVGGYAIAAADTVPCPLCGQAIVFRGAASVCTNCGTSPFDPE